MGKGFQELKSKYLKILYHHLNLSIKLGYTIRTYLYGIVKITVILANT